MNYANVVKLYRIMVNCFNRAPVQSHEEYDVTVWKYTTKPLSRSFKKHKTDAEFHQNTVLSNTVTSTFIY